MRRQVVGMMTAVAVGIGAASCGRELRTDLERLTESRLLTSDLLVQFVRTTDAANRVVMAGSDDTAAASAHESGEAASIVERDSLQLQTNLQDLGYAPESKLLEDFRRRWARYHELSQSVVTLALESTNVKAQRLSFGPAREAADAVEASLKPVRPASSTGEWKMRALAATAVGSVREIQALQAPHIAEADDARMTALEGRMTAAETSANAALTSLAGVVSPASAAHLSAARQAFDRFLALNKELIALSRRNSNVQALAMSMGQARVLAAACEESLHALADALAQRSASGATR